MTKATWTPTFDEFVRQEAALHRLGHLHERFPERVRRIVSARRPYIDAKLISYADAAAGGHVI